MLKCLRSSFPFDTAFVHINPSTAGRAASFYFKNCWFQETPSYALSLSNTDDIQILGCTFDSTSQRWLALGLNNPLNRVSVVGCTFKNVPNAGQIDMGTVDSFVFEANRVYWDGTNLTPYVVNALSRAVAISNLIVLGNVFEGCQTIVGLNSTVTNTIISNNTATAVNGTPAITIQSSSAVSSISITGNVFSGYAGSSKGMIDATNTPINNCVICNNTIIANSGGTSDYGINLPYGPVTNNSIAFNNLTGASTRNINVPTYAGNGISEAGQFQITLTGVSGVVTAYCKYCVEGNSVTLTLPNINGTSTATSATITGLSAWLYPSSVQSYLITVTNAGANVLGVISIGTSGVLSLYVGPAYGPFTASGNKGIQFCAITYQLG